MIDHPPRPTGHPIGRFVDACLNSAGRLALVYLFVAVMVPELQRAPAGTVLAITLAVGSLQAAVCWAVKARLRARWPAVDSLS